MILGKVIGHVWATRKEESLNGLKFLVIKPIDHLGGADRPEITAADAVGAGIGGDTVMVVRGGSSARKVLQKDHCPLDAMVVGIVDEVDVDRTMNI